MPERYYRIRSIDSGSVCSVGKRTSRRPERTERPASWWAGIGGILGIGIIYTLAFLIVALVWVQEVPGQLASALGLVCGLALLATAGWVVRAEYTGRQILRILVWTLLGIGFMGLLAVVFLVEDHYLGLTVRASGLLALQLTSLGALGGLFVGFYHRRQLQQTHRLEASLNRFKTLLTAAPTAIIALDHDGQVLVWNPSAEALFGWEQDEVLGEDYPIVPDGREDEFQSHLRMFADGEGLDGVETTRQHKDGSLIDVRIWSAPLHGHNGTPRGTIGILVDITEERRREEQLQVLSRVLRHNLRNGIAVINGRAEHLQKELEILETTLTEAPPTSRFEQLHRTQEAGDDLLREVRSFIDQLDTTLATVTPKRIHRDLDYIRETALDLDRTGKKARDIQQILAEDPRADSTIDVPTVVERVVDDLQDTFPDARIEYDGSLEEGEISGPSQFERAVRELIENAIVHNDHPDPAVTVTVTSGTDDRIRLEVADNGPGIAPYEREALDRGEETALLHGSGLGLWLVKWTVDIAGGDLSFDENDPRGTVVTLSLSYATEQTGGERASQPA